MMNRIRIYHATLATLAVLAYLTGELGIIHAWLGYGVAVVIAFRLLWADFVAEVGRPAPSAGADF